MRYRNFDHKMSPIHDETKATNAWQSINQCNEKLIFSAQPHGSQRFFQTFPHLWSFSRLFKAWKISTLFKLVANDVLPTINCTQLPENAIFVPGDLDLQTHQSEGPNTLVSWSLTSLFRTKHVFCMNLAQIRSAVPEIFHTPTKTTHWQRQKQNLRQFSACSN